MANWGYIRVSTDRQNTENQKLAILGYANKNHLKINQWIDVKAGSRKSTAVRRIDELLLKIQTGDTLIIAELSRLARSTGQVAILIDKLVKKKVEIFCIKENLSIAPGARNIQTKVLTMIFALLAEIERDLISERTKEGLARARKEGRILGRPKGSLGKSRLDSHETQIRKYLKKGVNIANLSKIYGVSWPTMKNFIVTRRLPG